MIRYRLNPVIFLINNGGYTIEVICSARCLLMAMSFPPCLS